MQVIVFGASGKVGRMVVEAALRRGHSVTVFVHSNSPFETQDGLKVVKGDVHDTEAVARAVRDHDAVISTLGSWHTPTKDILASAMGNIIPSMELSGIERIISLTGAGAYAPGDHPTPVYRCGHWLFGLFANKIIKDGELHIQQLHDSKLTWTVLRSPVMTGRHLAAYTLGRKAPPLWQTIPRKAVVKAILDQLEGPAYECQAPFIRPS